MQADGVEIDGSRAAADVAVPVTRDVRRATGNGDGGKTRLLTLSDLDGRTRASQHVRQAIAAISEDLGGVDRLSAAEHALVTRAALLGAMCTDVGVRWLSGEPIDPTMFVTLANAERSALEVVGLEARAAGCDVEPRGDRGSVRRPRAAARPACAF